MKKLNIILWVLVLFSGCSPALAQQQVINYPAITIYWNPATKIPDSVLWTSKPHKKVADRAAGFHATNGRLNEAADYAHSGYDIGHNANASDLNGNAIDEYNSFDYANAFPQLPQCNRLTWLALENQVRQLAIKYGHVENKVYWHGVKGHIGKDSVTVPLICIKEIWYNGMHEKYEVPNTDTVNLHPYTFYKVK